MSSSIHLTSLNKLSKPIFFGGGPQRSLRGGKRKNNYIMVYKLTNTSIFPAQHGTNTKPVPPIPGPFLLMAWLLNSHRFARWNPSRLRRGGEQQFSAAHVLTASESATAVWKAWMDSMGVDSQPMICYSR